ncbi:MAG: hypothetical protein JO242_29360, partial [Streptosporangiaceae bacterium]|nr:hypothetical protein [Streptosporangiaceae bacterium]
FPPPAIAGHPGAVVPPQVVYGILAQESNWNQASFHALAGYGGNPLVANYYGSTDPASPTDINYANADCGYGIAQITDLMKAGAANIDTQTAIAVDYAENIAASVSTLVGKWNQLASLGDLMNNGDPAKIENWYAAIWAYNSGVHLTSSGDPANGLGWLNNPANPIYPASRHPFLCADSSCTSYTDADTPQDWPYQEKVLGWIQGGQFDPSNPSSFRFTPLGDVLAIPPIGTFCVLSVNSCDSTQIGHSDPCPSENSACWWNQPVQWASCSAACTSGTFTISSPSAPEPAPTSRSVVCDEINSPSDLPSDAIIVADTALADQNPQYLAPNVVGCPDGATRNWHNSGLFELISTSGLEIGPSDLPSIDLHQLGAGFGGHTWFTHTRPASDAAHAAGGRWTPSLPGSGIYEIRVFIPTPGATTTHATYLVDGTYRRTVSQNNHSNQWVSIGYYPMVPGQSVTLSSITPASDASQGADIAFSAMAFTPVPQESYVALGDSYSSGEGTFGPWDEGTDVLQSDGAPADNMCHRSSNGFPRQYAALTQTFPSTAVVHLACSGGTLQDLDNIHWAKGPDGTIYFNPGSPYTTPAAPSGSSYSWNGGTGAAGEPASQVDVLRQIPAPKLVTVSLGIDDSGFASVLTTCVTHLSCQQAYTNPDGSDQLQKTINGLQAPVTRALQDIKAAVPAGTTIVVILYPVAFNSNSWTCTPFSQTDVAWLMARGHQLDQMLTAAATSAGVSYLNEENAFQGHELCTSDPYLNNLTTVDQSDKHTLNNSFHPTAGGYTKVAHDLRNYLSDIP